jgi:hypothetical protein
MLKKFASDVLASLRGSTYQSVRLTSSLAAALLDSLFEHTAGDPALSTYLYPSGLCRAKTEFFSKLLDQLLKCCIEAIHSTNDCLHTGRIR